MGLDQTWYVKYHCPRGDFGPDGWWNERPEYAGIVEALGMEPPIYDGYRHINVEVSIGRHRKNWPLHWIIKRQREERDRREYPELDRVAFSQFDMTDLRNELYDLDHSRDGTSRWPDPESEFGEGWREAIAEALETVERILQHYAKESTSIAYRASW